tara:strand:+ start:4087 stop:4218 length:132 start_codon:yes stop_codon:yes gene_type:complete
MKMQAAHSCDQLHAKHREIFQAIRFGDPERAVKAARDHMAFVQ